MHLYMRRPIYAKSSSRFTEDSGVYQDNKSKSGNHKPITQPEGNIIGIDIVRLYDD